MLPHLRHEHFAPTRTGSRASRQRKAGPDGSRQRARLIPAVPYCDFSHVARSGLTASIPVPLAKPRRGSTCVPTEWGASLCRRSADIGPVELERHQRRPDGADGLCGKGDVVRIAAHEREGLTVRELSPASEPKCHDNSLLACRAVIVTDHCGQILFAATATATATLLVQPHVVEAPIVIETVMLQDEALHIGLPA
jgi:hypothetical protein